MDSIDELIKMGKKQLEDGQYDDALNLFQRAMSLNQNDPDLWNLKGIALRSLGRYNEAIAVSYTHLTLPTILLV